MKFIEIIMGLALVSLGIITSITDVKKAGSIIGHY